MKAISKIVIHNIVASFISIVLLFSSVCIMTVAYSSLNESVNQQKRIDKQYITIAIPSGANQDKLFEAGSYRSIGFDSKEFSDKTRYIGPIDAENTAIESDNYIASDHRILLSAHISNGIPLSSGTLDELQYNAGLDTYCYQLTVFALRCTSIHETQYEFYNAKNYEAEFEIIDLVSGVDAYDIPPYNDTLLMNSILCTKEGDIPFEVGKTYLIRGRYWDYEVTELTQEWVKNDMGVDQLQWKIGRNTQGSRRILIMDPQPPLMQSLTSETGVASGIPNWIMERRHFPGSDDYYWCTPEESCWPFYAEYTGSWIDYLDTEEGRVWKDEIIPNFEMNHTSVPVMLTDNVESLYAFNSGEVSLLEGVLFSNADYLNGNRVCLISSTYAKLNHLSVGDTIDLDFYQTGYESYSYPLSSVSGKTGITIARYPLTTADRLDIQQEYMIVGIYTGPNWSGSKHAIHADTILVPKASVPDADKYVGPSLPLLNTVIIENGSIDVFEAHMAANDKAGAYLYFDQGYTEAAATIQVLIDNAIRIMVVGISMFILSSLLFILLYIRRTVPVIRTMRLLGVSSKKAWHECFVSLVWLVVIAVFIGNTLAIVLYDRITRMVLSTSLELSYGSVILCGSIQFLVLFIVGMLWTRSVANRNLMQKR